MFKLKYVFLVLFFITNTLIAQNLKVFILHSYSQEYKWTKNQHRGFVKTLENSNYNFDFYTEYLDTKRLPYTGEYEQQFLNYLKIKYKNIDPDLVYVSDDNALLFMYLNYKALFGDSKKIPVFFSGINNLDMEKLLYRGIFRGVYEIKEVEPNIELIKQFSPQTRDIYFIGDASNTYESIHKEISEQEQKFSNIHFHYISKKHIDSVISNLPKSRRSFVLLTTIGEFKDKDERTLSPNESISLLEKNKNLIILSMEDAYMYHGVVGGYVTSGQKQGSEAAGLVLQYLKSGSLDTVKSIKKSPNVYLFDSKALSNARVVLSEYVARNAKIIGKDKDFIEQNKSILLDILILIIFALLIAIVVLYALQKKRCSLNKRNENKVTKTTQELASCTKVLERGFNLAHVGHWKLDIQNEKIFVSQELMKRLDIDLKIYKNDPLLIHYFIHSNDKDLFERMLKQVVETTRQVRFYHKMFNVRKKVFDVEHLVYIESEKNGKVFLVGIVKFEK